MSIAPKTTRVLNVDTARAELRAHESEMDKCKHEFARRLAIIRDERIYKWDFSTFEDYCQTRWGIGKNIANKKIAATKIADALGTIVPIPNEGTAREFKEVPKEDRPKVAETAKEIAAEKGRDTINSRDVKEAKAKVYDTKPRVTESIVNPDGEAIEIDDEPTITLVTDDPDDWIKTLPLYSQLSGLPKRRFEEAAKLWQQFEPVMKTTAAAIRTAQNKIAFQFRSRFMSRQLVSFITEEPQHWSLCATCKGSGQIPQVGNCDACRGDGWHPTTVKR